MQSIGSHSDWRPDETAQLSWTLSAGAGCCSMNPREMSSRAKRGIYSAYLVVGHEARNVDPSSHPLLGMTGIPRVLAFHPAATSSS